MYGTTNRLPWRRSALVAGMVAGVIVAAMIFAPASSADPPTSEEKLEQGDPSHVTTWSAGDGLDAAAAPAQIELEFVGFSTGCRFLDTRLAGGPIGAGQSRDVSVLDAQLPGSLGPCGVPARARAVQLSISTIAGSASATGFARVGPGGVAPTATVLQFGPGAGVSVTTTARLSASSTLRIASFGSGAGYVGDLLGYWQEPVWARVTAAGTLIAGSGIVSITKSASFAGDYLLYIDRPVGANCVATVSPESSAIRVLAVPATTYYFVDARAYNSTAEADGAFSFILQC